MKVKITLISILVVSTQILCNIASADALGSVVKATEEATNAITNGIKDVTGDWCSGKQYFSDMKLSDRLKSGSEDLQEEIEKLNDASSKMEFDIRQNIEKEVDKTIGGAQDLSKMNNDLCTQAKLSNYVSVNYNGSVLRDKNEVMAQMRLNLATIRTSNAVVNFFNDQKAEFNQLNDRIKSKANELAVLRKNFDNLSDPRSENKGSSYVESVIGNACTAIGEGESLIMEYSNKNSAELFRNAAQNNQTKSIPDSEVTTFMESCSGTDAENQKGLIDKAKSLFGF